MFVPDRDKNGNIIVTLAPFASKNLPNGSLFKRVHGVSGSVPANSITNIDLIVPYITAKFNGAEIIGCQFGDTVNFKVLDNASGTISGVPNYMLNQFGFDVCMPNDFYKNTSEYDADLTQGMVIRCEYTNNDSSAKTICLNMELHEVKA